MRPAARKYRNVPTEVGGIKFASKREAFRYCELKLLQKAGEIRDLKLQPRYPLVVDGELVCTFVGDFDYIETKSGRLITEDSKGHRTPVFDLKFKLFRAIHKREIALV